MDVRLESFSQEQQEHPLPSILVQDDKLRQQMTKEEELEGSLIYNDWDFDFNEFRLTGDPSSLQDFTNLGLGYCKDAQEDYKTRVIWMGKDTFVVMYLLPYSPCSKWFHVGLDSHDGAKVQLGIHGPTLEEAMSTLEYLLQLDDTFYKSIRLVAVRCNQQDRRDANGRRNCPFSCQFLQKMILANPKRLCWFWKMCFTPEQCRTLAVTGTQASLGFKECKFIDHGAAFVEALQERGNKSSDGPANLSFSAVYPTDLDDDEEEEGDVEDCLRFPMSNPNLVLVLHELCLCSLRLEHIRLETEAVCRAVTTANIQYLELDDCEFQDGGAALVESVRQGRGPKEIYLNHFAIGSESLLVSLFEALRGNSHLELLVLGSIRFRYHGLISWDEMETTALYRSCGPSIFHQIIGPLRENKGLRHLGFHDCVVDALFWNALVEAIANHPSLLVLEFGHIQGQDSSAQGKVKTTAVFADMLLKNHQFENIVFAADKVHSKFPQSDWTGRAEVGLDQFFDRTIWNSLVQPRLARNVDEKRCLQLQITCDLSAPAP